jgi:hypothetical protein
MKNRSKIFGLTLSMFLMMAIPSIAQVSFDHLGLGVSYWNRTYSGADERSFLVDYPGDGDFSQGGIMPTLSAGILLYEGFGVDGRIGIWSATFSGEDVFTDGFRIKESIKQTVVPLTLGVFYSYKDVVPDKIHVFAGAGVNRYFIQNTAERSVSDGEGNVPSRTFNGNDYGFYGKLGAEYMLSGSISAALDARYNTGSYDKRYTPEFGAPAVSRNVSLKGLEVGLSFRYRFVVSSKE